jgi:DNA-binding transcriptional LysR family regulator
VETPADIDRLRRLIEFWNWLPAYRAVAETEHVRTAAERLRVSPSALSRSIGLLEENLGEQLFEREGRGIRLNRAGQEFLESLRAAMRLIEDGLKAVESNALAGTFYVAIPDNLFRLLLGGLRSLQDEHPELKVQVIDNPNGGTNPMLARGHLDLAFTSNPEASDDVVVEKFVETTNGVYCGTDHPLASEVRPTVEQIAAHSFVTYGKDEARDSWPAETPRRIAMHVERLQSAVESTAFGGLLSILPDHVAAPYTDRGVLHRIPLDTLPGTQFFTVRRRKMTAQDRSHRVLEFLQTYVDSSTEASQQVAE